MTSSSSSQGTSPGALAGAVVGALLVLALIVFGYLYYRRREAGKEAAARERMNVDVKPDIPARADAVLSRPDPHFAVRASSLTSAEKSSSVNGPTELGAVRVYNSHPGETINLGPVQPVQSSAVSARSNPFTDKLSFQTASERSTDVIPIALVPPGGHNSQPSNPPSRPLRAPGTLFEHNDVTDTQQSLIDDSPLEDVHLPYASSTRSGISGKSFMTTSSIDPDEAPQIITSQQGVVRQVLGMSQAQVVRVPSDGSAFKARARGALARHASKGTIGRSPLAQQAFTPEDVPLTRRQPSSPTSSRRDPFTDAASPNQRESFADSARTTDTFGNPSQYHSEGPFTPRPGTTFPDAHHRPISVASTADGVSIRADIGTASRVILGTQGAPMYAGMLTSPRFDQSRATSMQTNSGRTIDHDDSESLRRPYSIASAKTTSSRADSVLAGYPFVAPPLPPILPSRSPGAGSPAISPASSGSTFAKQQALATPLPNSPPLSPRSTTTTQGSITPRIIVQSESSNSRSRSASTFSSSTASGLETYPFQFGDEHNMPPPRAPRNRASLDTLKIAQDLAAFPLELDGYPGDNNGRR